MSKLIDLTGQTFGRLTVIKRVENAKNNKAHEIHKQHVPIKSTHTTNPHQSNGKLLFCNLNNKV